MKKHKTSELVDRYQKKKKKRKSEMTSFLAEREGFEPPVPLSTPVFKTGAFDHSAISPIQSDDYSLVS